MKEKKNSEESIMEMAVYAIPKLVKIYNVELLKEVIEKIKIGEKVPLSLSGNGLTIASYNGDSLLAFETCRCGNPIHNLHCVLRDIMNLTESEKWTLSMIQKILNN